MTLVRAGSLIVKKEGIAMGLTSEHVHWFFGTALFALAGLLLLRALGKLRGPWPSYVVPAAPAIY